MQGITDKLSRLEEFHAQREALSGQKQDLIDQVLPPEVKARMGEIEAEFGQKAEALEANIEALEAEIKVETLAHGATVKGGRFQAVWNKGRDTWDGKGLGAYAESHPEVLTFRKQGEPTVTIRRAGKESS